MVIHTRSRTASVFSYPSGMDLRSVLVVTVHLVLFAVGCRLVVVDIRRARMQCQEVVRHQHLASLQRVAEEEFFSLHQPIEFVERRHRFGRSADLHLGSGLPPEQK